MTKILKNSKSEILNPKQNSKSQILNSKFEILNEIQPRTNKEFWVAQNLRWFWAKSQILNVWDLEFGI